MVSQKLIEYCLTKSGAYKDFPFGQDCVVIKVEKKIFAQFFTLNGKSMATLNSDALQSDFYRSLYNGVIVRGYHCPPVQQPYFNTFEVDAVADDFELEMIDYSYNYVVSKLPKYVQKRLNKGM